MKSASSPKIAAEIAKEPTEACKAFVIAMNLMSKNLTATRVKCLFQPDGMVEVRQVFLRILGHLISHCKTIYALEAVVATLRRWILGKKSRDTETFIAGSYPPVTVLPELLSDKEKEVFLKKLHQFVMRFRETPAAIPLVTNYLDIVYQLSCRYGLVPTGTKKVTWLQSKIKAGWTHSKSPGNSGTTSRARSAAPKRHCISSKGGTTGSPSVSTAHAGSKMQHGGGISLALRNLLQRPFTSALLSPNPEQREQFFTLLLEKFSESGKLASAKEKLRTVLEYDWEPVAPRFWLPQASGFLLSGVADGSIIELGGTTPGFESFLQSEWIKTHKESRGISPLLYAQNSDTSALISSQGKFLTSVASFSRFKYVIGSLQELSNADAGIAIEMWEQIFPAMWDKLPQTSQATLVAPLTRLISQSYHSRQLALPAGHGYRRNIVMVLLGSIAKCKRNRPVLAPELVKYLGCTYNSWYTAVEIMEERFLSAARAGREDDTNALARSLQLIFQKLNNASACAGVRRVTARTPESLAVLDLMAMGQWSQAQEAVVKAMEVQSNNNGSYAGSSSNPEETHAWESDWVQCARELGQWTALREYGISRRDPYVMLDAAWKLSDWNAVKVCFNMPAIGALAECQLPDCRLMLYQIYNAVVEGRTNEVESLCKQGVELVLQRWQSLPGASTSSDTHCEALQMFQNLVELEESSKLMKQITKATINGIRTQFSNIGAAGGATGASSETQLSGKSGHAKVGANNSEMSATEKAGLPDSSNSVITASNLELNFEQIIHTWRNRLPNKWDSASVWADTLTWRQHMFSLVVRAFKGRIAPNQMSHLHDSEWTMLKLAQIARNQNLPEFALRMLNHTAHTTIKISGQTRQIPETATESAGNAMAFKFQRLREKVRSMFEDPLRLEDALHEVVKTDVSKLAPWQCAEIFSLKALILERMGPDRYHPEMLKPMPPPMHEIELPSSATPGQSSAKTSPGIDSATAGDKEEMSDSSSKDSLPEKASATATPKNKISPESVSKVKKPAPQIPLTPTIRMPPRDHLVAAMQSFSDSCAVSNNQGHLWIEWARFYDRQLHKVTKGVADSPDNDSSHALGVKPLEGQSLDYAASAMSTYLQAVHCSHDPATRLVLARVLRLLQCGDREGRLVAVFATHVEQSPMWCWITWIPQLLQSLSKPEAIQVFSILYGLSNMFPQAVYHALRCFLLEQRANIHAKELQVQQARALERKKMEESSKAVKGSKDMAKDASGMINDIENIGNDMTQVEKGSAGAEALIDSKSSWVPYYAEAKRYGLATQYELEEFAKSKPARSSLPMSKKYMSRTGHVLEVAAGTAYSKIASGLPDGGSGRKHPNQYAEELMAFLRKTHTSLTSEIESFLGELITRFKPGPEQELLSAVLMLRQKCFQMSSTITSDGPREGEGFMRTTSFMQTEAPQNLIATLKRVGERYFKSGSNIRNPKVRAFCETFRDRYFEDFVYVKSIGPPLLIDIVNRLDVWRRALKIRLKGIPIGAGQYGIQGWHQEQMRARKAGKGGQCMVTKEQSALFAGPVSKRQKDPGVPTRSRDGHYLALERRSKMLASFSSDVVEIPGQYLADAEPQMSLHSKISGIDSKYEIVQRPGLSRAQCRLTFIGDNGMRESFLVQYCVPAVTPTDERTMQLYHLTNRILLQHRPARRMNLQAHLPLIVPIAPRVRLAREGTTFVSLAHIFERDCDARGLSVLAPAIAMHDINGAAGNPLMADTEERRARRLGLYLSICDELCNPALITEYLTERLPTAEARWSVRNQLTKQWAISSLLSHIFHIGHRNPSNFVLALDTGNLLSLNFRPEYHRDTGRLIEADNVPFRLTPALQHLMSPIGVQGAFAETMMCMADGLHDQLEFVEDFSTLFFSSDMMPWYDNHVTTLHKQMQKDAAREVESDIPPVKKLRAKKKQKRISASNRKNSADSKMQALNFVEAVDRNVCQVLQRIRRVAPLDKPPAHDRTSCFTSNSRVTKQPSGLNQQIHQLIKAASSPENLSQQDTMWAPYF